MASEMSRENERHKAFMKKQAGGTAACLNKLPEKDRNGNKIEYPKDVIDEYSQCAGIGLPFSDRFGNEILYKEEGNV